MTVINNSRWDSCVAGQLIETRARMLAMRLDNIKAPETDEYKALQKRYDELVAWRNGSILNKVEEGYVFFVA